MSEYFDSHDLIGCVRYSHMLDLESARRIDIFLHPLFHLWVPTRPDAAPRDDHKNIETHAHALVYDLSQVVHHCRGRFFHIGIVVDGLREG